MKAASLSLTQNCSSKKSSKEHIFELAEKFEARQQEKEAAIDEKAEDKGSVLKDLKDKQKETAAKTPAKDAVEKAAKSKGGEAL